jgi:methionyl-tRNA synthetase
MSLAQETNRYLDEKSPWKTIKQDRQASATALYVAISVLSCLRTALYPFLPFSSKKLHELLGFKGSIESDGWQLRMPAAGQRLLPPEPLFSKLDEELVEEETNRLGQVK